MLPQRKAMSNAVCPAYMMKQYTVPNNNDNANASYIGKLTMCTCTTKGMGGTTSDP